MDIGGSQDAGPWDDHLIRLESPILIAYMSYVDDVIFSQQCASLYIYVYIYICIYIYISLYKYPKFLRDVLG